MEQQVIEAKGSFELAQNELFEARDNFENSEDSPEGIVYTIPVVFHVIYETATDNISRDQIVDAIRVLNEDYRRQNADAVNTRSIFAGVAADMEVEFKLAKLDPSGNCTDGVTRTFSTLTEGANDNVKGSNVRPPWNNKKYLNVWVVRSIALGNDNSTLGYATLPVSGGNPVATDGIVIRHDQVGTFGTASDPTLQGASNEYGRTLTHEVGHYLGLLHTFQGGCFGLGDGCADTPPVLENNFGCNLTINSCSNDSPDLPDMIENYMDYSDGVCLNVFTEDQKAITRAVLVNPTYRNQLVSNGNKTATGIADNQVLPCAPTVDFDANKTLICEGESVQFNDRTYMGNPTSYLWTFAGGSPATSTDANPLVTYNTKGNYSVNLIVTNANGSSDTLQNGYVSVRSQSNTPYVNAFGDNFEMYPIPNENWHVVPGADTMNFRYFTKAAYAGQSCVTLQNFNAYSKETDEMISHTISLYNSKDAQLTFWHAFAQRAQTNSDVLTVYASDDCGDTWTTVGTKLGPFLRTTNTRINDTAWYPTLASEWTQSTMSLNAFAYSPNPIMLKFSFVNGGGNCLYIDEVLLATTIGTEELFAENGPKIYPNPANNMITVELERTGGTISLSDVSGRMMFKKTLLPTEKVTVLNVSDLAPGVYLITTQQDGLQNTHKIIVQ